MKSQILILFYISFLLIFSCSKPETTRYYNTGEVKEVLAYESISDTSKYLYTAYYKNGHKKSSGKVVNGEKTGPWTEWYSDGDVRWSCDYEQRYEIKKDSYVYQFVIEHKVLKVNQPTRIRVNVLGIFSGTIAIVVSNGIIKHLNEDGMYDFTIIPDKIGKEDIHIKLVSPDDMRFIDVAHFSYIVIE